MKQLSQEKVKECLELGWTLEQIEKGYDIFEVSGSEDIINGALVVQLINDVAKFDSDWDACRQAEQDGIKFINDMDGLEKGCYIDTVENRKHCAEFLAKHPEYRIEHLIIKEGENSQYYKRYKNYFNL